MFRQTFNFYRCFFWGFLILLDVPLVGCGNQRISAVDGSEKRGTPAVPVMELVDKLTKGDLLAKLDTLELLRKYGADAKPAIPTLIKILEDGKSPIPGAAIAVEQKRIPRAEVANPTLRYHAISVLEKIGPDAKPAIPALLLNLKDKSGAVRMASVRALAEIAEDEDKVLSGLKETLNDVLTDVRRLAAEVLSELNPESLEAVSTLTKLLKDKDPEERHDAAMSLRQIRSKRIKTAIPDLLIALKDSEEKVREMTADSLGSICEESNKVVPALIERLEKDQSAKVRVQAAQALQEYGPEAKSAIPALTRAMMEDPDSVVRQSAAQAKRRINIMPAKRGEKGAEEELLQMYSNNPEFRQWYTKEPALKKSIEKLRRRRVRDNR